MPSESTEFDLQKVLRVLWRRKWIVVGTVVVVTVAAFLIKQTTTPQEYRANAVVAVNPQTVNQSLSDNPTPAVGALAPVARIIVTTRFARLAARGLKPSADPHVLREQIKVRENDEAGVLTITASANSPKRAADIANAYGRVTVRDREYAARQTVDLAIKQLQGQLARLESPAERLQLSRQLQRLRALRAGQNANAQLLEPAFRGEPIDRKVSKFTLTAFMISILVGLALALLVDRLDRRIRSEQELESLTGLPLLSTVPLSAFPSEASAGVASATGPGAEAFRRLRAGLIYFNVSQPVKSVLITSPGSQEGKTTIAVNLALAAARQGKNVLLIDADLHRPRVHERLGLEAGRGLSDVLSANASLDDSIQTFQAGDGRLSVLPAGTVPPNPSELLASERMQSLLETPMDLIVLDTAPLLAVSDAIPLLKQVSGIIVAARIDATTRDGVKRVAQTVRTAEGTVLGVVATGVETPESYGYGYGYGYGESTNGDGETEEAALRPLDPEQRS